jgi:hypothetical protein
MAQSGKAWIGWILGMLQLPPLLGFGILMLGRMSDSGVQIALIFYALAMLAMGIAAALHLGRSTAMRVGLFFALVVGMLVAQCAVFFVGCSILVNIS